MDKQQSEKVMRQQQQRIIQLQQMCGQMRSDMHNMKQGRQQLWDKDVNLQQGLSHLDMLNDFEMVSKSNPYSNKYSYLNRVRQNPLNSGDSLNQFIEQYSSGNTPQQRSQPPSQQSQMRQYNQDPRFNMNQQMNSNRFKNVASLSLNQQPYDQSTQQDPYYQNNMPSEQQYQFNINQSKQQENFQRENKINPILSKIEQQNEMLMKLIEDMDKPQLQNKKKSLKKKYDDLDNNNTQNNENKNPSLMQQRELEKKIQQLESQINQQKMSNQYMLDNNILNSDAYSIVNPNPQDFANTTNNKPQFSASNMPGSTFTQTQPQKQNTQNFPSPDQFLQQVQMNTNQKFQIQPPQMNGSIGVQNNLIRPSFINEKSSVPHPSMLQQIFEQQLLNSQKRNQN